MKQLSESVYYVGAINPGLRIFDIIMNTEYGTTYNSYLVKGEKNALIETVHDSFSDVFFDNIRELLPLEKIDYIIMNHTEPDHSGSIRQLIEINPEITVIGSAAAIKNIKAITNCDFKSRIVKTGDTLDLGDGKVLSFIISPNLHWPDSMFTYFEREKTVFTCDFLGAHYCEPRITDNVLSCPKAYEAAFEYYYNAIFGPFKKFVLDGLKRLEELDFDTVCCSHGPVLRTNIKHAMDKYREWSEPKTHEKNVAIFYVSAYGYTKSIAEAFEKELNAFGVKAKSYDIIRTCCNELYDALESSTAIMLGSPTINRDALKPVWDLISSFDAVNCRGKSCLVFGSYGWSGEACGMLENRVKDLGLKLPCPAFKVVFKPDDNDFVQIKQAAKDFAAALN